MFEDSWVSGGIYGDNIVTKTLSELSPAEFTESIPAFFDHWGKRRWNGGLGVDIPGGGEFIVGRGFNDRITGSRGDDVILGRGGNDVLRGGAGNDVLSGGEGRDTLTGGGGSDHFFLASSTRDRDIITDFNPDQDKIRLDRGMSLSSLTVTPQSDQTIIHQNGRPLSILLNTDTPLSRDNFLTPEEVRRYERQIVRSRRQIETSYPGFSRSYDYYQWGEALAGLGYHEEAISKYNSAIRLKGWNDPKYQLSLGDSHLALGKTWDAIHNYKKALRGVDKWGGGSIAIEANMGLGLAYASRGSHARAIQHYNRVIQYQWGNDEAHYQRGLSHLAQRRYDWAIWDIEQATALNPNEASYYMKLGEIHDRLGEYQFSEWSYSQAIRVDDFSADAYYQRGLARREMGRFDARFDFQEAARLYQVQQNWSARSQAIQESYRPIRSTNPRRPYDAFYNPYYIPEAGPRFVLPYDPPIYPVTFKTTSSIPPWSTDSNINTPTSRRRSWI
ncbi:hypothetical protein AY600_01440 [Phormidium willei BDU 130791]|nr:hypothetical protein AY600_01440 [Phormidium willei BDU 130791]